MDAWQILIAVLAAAGGGPGVSQFVKIIRGVKQPPTVRDFRNSELGQIQFKLAEVYENSVTHSGTLARIEGILRTAKGRLDDMDLLIAQLMDGHRELSSDHRELAASQRNIIHRVEQLEERGEK